MVTEDQKGNESCRQTNKRYPKRRRESKTVCERCSQEGPKRSLCGSGQGDDQAGIIEEMLEDTFESMDDQEEMEEAAEMEIDRILFEITAGALGKAPSKVTDALPEPEPAGAMAASEGDEEDDEEDLEAMQSRLATLRS
ncbi:vacuolar protein sorting 24 (yeast), isoform CRA_a [Rattus norvegicus]|uniref:Vacuolar protein sorting 24 (Yeast), isoform CRA_a n=1 Tax=Rattus norvegicus TaxID=10116 RepID=A6IA81_RAT|nr:vacuolar protein sorting 24 (yeast), isoform CRA_a [Rattus norvegicus]EDL90998.1 vacuolar protein sorting 24 (yeast), isoform CRA_a [Rattus norvegicus]